MSEMQYANKGEGCAVGVNEWKCVLRKAIASGRLFCFAAAIGIEGHGSGLLRTHMHACPIVLSESHLLAVVVSWSFLYKILYNAEINSEHPIAQSICKHIINFLKDTET